MDDWYCAVCTKAKSQKFKKNEEEQNLWKGSEAFDRAGNSLSNDVRLCVVPVKIESRAVLVWASRRARSSAVGCLAARMVPACVSV